MFTCLGCDGEFAGPSWRSYCTNACQFLARQAVLVEAWLRTGEANIAGNRNHYVRRFILAEQQHRCAVCQSPQEWHGLPLVLVLDNVDGDAENNRRENLRMGLPPLRLPAADVQVAQPRPGASCAPAAVRRRHVLLGQLVQATPSPSASSWYGSDPVTRTGPV